MNSKELYEAIKQMRNDMISELKEVNARRDVLLTQIAKINHLLTEFEEEQGNG